MTAAERAALTAVFQAMLDALKETSGERVILNNQPK